MGFIDSTHSADYGSVEEELADVFILLVDISNKLNMDLFECFKNKEKINMKRKWVRGANIEK